MSLYRLHLRKRLRPKVLFVGLTSPRSYSYDVLSFTTKKIVLTPEKLELYEFGFIVPQVKGINADYIEFTESIITTLIDYYRIGEGDADHFSLKVIVSIDEVVFPDLGSLEQEW
jgi:hypothetical protein